MRWSPAEAPASALRSHWRWRAEGARVTIVGRRRAVLEAMAAKALASAIVAADMNRRGGGRNPRSRMRGK